MIHNMIHIIAWFTYHAGSRVISLQAAGVKVAGVPAGARSARGRRRLRLPRRARHTQRLPTTARGATGGPPVVPLLAPAAHPRSSGARLQAALFARVAPGPHRARCGGSPLRLTALHLLYPAELSLLLASVAAPALNAPDTSRVVALTYLQLASALAAAGAAGAAKPLLEDDTTPNSIHALIASLEET